MTRTSFGENLTWKLLQKWARLRPDDECLVFEERRWTWATLERDVASSAAFLLARGVKIGDRVAVYAHSRPEFIISFLASGRIGASWAGFSPKYPAHEIRPLLRKSAPKVLFAACHVDGKDECEVVESLIAATPSIHTIVAIEGQCAGSMPFAQTLLTQPDTRLGEREAEVHPDLEALLIFTSGSSGEPKGVLHTHRSLTSNVAIQSRQWGLAPGSRLASSFPINHAAAVVAVGLASIAGGATVVLEERFDARKSLATLKDERINVVAQVPAMFLLQMALPEFDLSLYDDVRAFIWSGARAPANLIDVLIGLRDRNGARLSTGYGLSETCGFVTFSQIDDTRDQLVESVGRAVAPHEARIVDETGNVLPFGEAGEIQLRGPAIMSGYLDDPDATAKTFAEDGWLRTGDIGWMDDTGAIRLTGRMSEMMKCGGEKVAPAEIERVLGEHEAVAQAVVVPVADDVFQEVPAAFVVCKRGLSVSESELVAWCRSRLAVFKSPKLIQLVPEIPLLPSGKPARRELIARAAELRSPIPSKQLN